MPDEIETAGLLVQQPAQSVHMGQRTLTMILLHRAPGVALELTVHLVQPHASSVLLASLTTMPTLLRLVRHAQPDDHSRLRAPRLHAYCALLADSKH